jgi:regulator of protease activity HflC (stomatin/prohibitin superfamily)
MGVFILALIIIAMGLLGLVAALMLDLSPKTNKRGYEEPPFIRRSVAIAIAVGVMALGGLMVFFDSYVIIPARNVGIVNTFGKAEATLDNGWHWVKPWSSVEHVDATVQNINLDQDTKNCIAVRLQNQTTACIDVTLQWNIDQHANANNLWQSYRGPDGNVVAHVGKNVVERELTRALGNVFTNYNPLVVLSDPNNKQPSADELAKQALDQMRQFVDPGIVVSSLLIPTGGIHYDDVTQQKLNAFAQALADTQIAIQNKLTAEQQKLANDLLAAASSNDPGVKFQNCLNLIKDLAAKNQLQNLPQTFNCSEGSATPVILNARGN